MRIVALSENGFIVKNNQGIVYSGGLLRSFCGGFLHRKMTTWMNANAKGLLLLWLVLLICERFVSVRKVHHAKSVDSNSLGKHNYK